MSLLKKAIFSLAAGLITKKIVSLASELEVDDVLRPIGLARRRSHFGGAFLTLGAGVAIGGATALLLSPSSGKEVRALLSKLVTPSHPKTPEESPSVPEAANGANDSVNVHVPN